MIKYMVFKFDDVQAASASNEISSDLLSKVIPDAWVIRKQDTHAASTAYAYANAVQSTIEILDSLPGDCIPDGTIDQLEVIRDTAFEYAESARAAQSRLPD